MARAIPDVPLDGETYASVGVAGLPMVLEYDGPTGGYKMVVSTEAGVAINISGTVEITGGQLTVVGAAQYGEDTPHTSGQTGTFIMGVRQDALASSVGADGDYAGLQVDSLGRLRVLSYGSNFLAPLNSSQYAEDSMFVGGMTGTMVLAVRTDNMQTWVSDDGDLATLNVDALGRLYTFTTGSFVFADTELPPAAALSDVFTNPTAPAVGAFLMGINRSGGDWARLDAQILQSGAQIDTPDLTDAQFGILTVGGVYGNHPTLDDRLLLVNADTERRLQVRSFVTGTVDTELPAAAVAADGYANPTAPSVLSHLMGYNGVTWDRLYMGISGSLAVDLISQLDAVNDEITAYVTGTLTVDTELSAGVVLSDGMGNPTPPAVGAFGMGWDGLDWNRIRVGSVGEQVVSITGTVSVDIATDLPLVVTEDEVTAYITGSTSLNLGGKTIVRAVIDVSGSAAGEETLVAAVGGQKIKILETMLIGNADVSIFFQSGYTGTALTGPLSLPADGDGFFVETPAQMEAHHFETIAGEALVLDIDANVLIGGWINYYTEA